MKNKVEFEIGDSVVVVGTYSPRMVVVGVDQKIAITKWFDIYFHVQQENFPLACLQNAESDPS